MDRGTLTGLKHKSSQISPVVDRKPHHHYHDNYWWLGKFKEMNRTIQGTVFQLFLSRISSYFLESPQFSRYKPKSLRTLLISSANLQGVFINFAPFRAELFKHRSIVSLIQFLPGQKTEIGEWSNFTSTASKEERRYYKHAQYDKVMKAFFQLYICNDTS